MEKMKEKREVVAHQAEEEHQKRLSVLVVKEGEESLSVFLYLLTEEDDELYNLTRYRYFVVKIFGSNVCLGLAIYLRKMRVRQVI